MVPFWRAVFRRTADMFRGIKGNTRALLAFEPMWVIPYSMYSVYAAVYMRELGLSPRRIGLVASAGLASYMACSAFAGHLTDRLGRRRTTFIFDLLGWSVPTLIWAGAQNFGHFLLAAVINGISAITSTSWNCWVVEDTAPKDRIALFGILQMIGLLGGLVTPLAGLAIGAHGVVKGSRLLYLFAFASMTAMFLGRNHFAAESKVGRARQQATGGHGFLRSFKDYAHTIALLWTDGRGFVLLLLQLILAFRESLVAPFHQLYLVDRLDMAETVLAGFPAYGALTTFTALILILPCLRGKDRVGLFWGLGLSIAATAVLLCAPPGSVAAVILSTLFAAAGTAILRPALDTGWNNALGDEERAKAVALLMLLLGLVRLPGGVLGGLLYDFAPIWVPAAGALLLLGGVLLLLCGDGAMASKEGHWPKFTGRL